MGREVAPLLDLVKGVASPYIKFPKIWVDNYVFRLHCKLTALILFLSCTLVSIGMYWGDPIDCIVEGVPDGVMDTYCWLHSTFTLPHLGVVEIDNVNGVDQEPHPGVGPVYDDLSRITEHKYYQWVGFVLLLQGILFLGPYMLWKFLEGGRVANLIPDCLVHTVSDARMPGFATDVYLVEKEQKEDAVEKMRRYFVTRNLNVHTRENRHYFIKFALCELLNFVNVFGQIYFMNFFFGGAFSTYGSEVLKMSNLDPENRNDPLNDVFPKVAKCSFSKYGSSGTVERYDGLCILSLNIFNEKIYILLWFWFVFLTVVSGLNLVWRVGTFLSGRMREWILRSQATLEATPEQVATVTQHLSLGDWFILLQIGENIDTRIYLDLIAALAKSFQSELTNGLRPRQEVSTDV